MRQLHRLVDGGVRGHALEEENLVGAHAQDVLDPGLHLREPDVDQPVECPIDATTPAQRAFHQLVEQTLVARIGSAHDGG